MWNNFVYFLKNKKIWAKIWVIFHYTLLWFFSLFFKPIQFFKKEKIYFFEDRPFGIDNAYFLYKYYKKNFPNIESVYLVKNKKDALYKKLENDKNVVYEFSLQHFWYFIWAEKLIFSYDTSPFYFFGKLGIFLKKIFKPCTKMVFLQHGVTKSFIPFFRKENNIFSWIVVNSQKEEKYFIDEFWYNKEDLLVSWFPRFDNLYKNREKEKQIFFFPTWNSKLAGLTQSSFQKTDYYNKIKEFLESSSLSSWLEKNKYSLYYYPHQWMAEYVNLFSTKSKNIIILDDNNKENISIPQLILESSLLITDYSSIVFDFAYQHKPTLYYNIWENHYPSLSSYFYDFWEKVASLEEIIEKLNILKKNNFKMQEKYTSNTDNFFEYIDSKNCERTSLLINNL